MSEKIMFTFHSDPGHGWLEVDWSHLKRLGMNPSEFSKYSYRDGNTFYLEEDCDAPKFIEKFEARHGKLRFIERYAEHTFIRELPCIHE